ncbi:hypothetical protein pb186bvf_008531 [Paramecium bursaria]
MKERIISYTITNDTFNFHNQHQEEILKTNNSFIMAKIWNEKNHEESQGSIL